MDNRALGGEKQAHREPCAACKGTGKVPAAGGDKPCITCRGTGVKSGGYLTK